MGTAALAVAFAGSASTVGSLPAASRLLSASRLVSPAMVVESPSFTSDGAKSQVGNDAFLNEDLMGRAIRGTGVKSDKKLKIGIVGAGLAGMVAAMDLADAGHEVEMFELRPFVGGKVSSWKDKDDNHIEMGLHVFFGCYYNLFGIMKRTGSYDLLRLKEHTHTFINSGGVSPQGLDPNALPVRC
jgi:zeta-carotene desaturase